MFEFLVQIIPHTMLLCCQLLRSVYSHTADDDVGFGGHRLKHVVILQHLSSLMWLLHMFPSITEILKEKSPLDQKILVILHRGSG